MIKGIPAVYNYIKISMHNIAKDFDRHSIMGCILTLSLL